MGWNARLDDAKEHIFRHSLRRREAQQAFRASEAAVPRVLAATKGQALIEVRDAKVIDVDHAACQLGRDALALGMIASKHGCA